MLLLRFFRQSPLLLLPAAKRLQIVEQSIGWGSGKLCRISFTPTSICIQVSTVYRVQDASPMEADPRVVPSELIYCWLRIARGQLPIVHCALCIVYRVLCVLCIIVRIVHCALCIVIVVCCALYIAKLGLRIVILCGVLCTVLYLLSI